MLFCVTHQDYKKVLFPVITSPQDTILSHFLSLPRKIAQVFTHGRTVICCQLASSASILYWLCFIHGFLYSWDFAKNIRPRVIFRDGLGLCSTDQSVAVFNSVQCAGRMYWGAAGGLQSEESPLTMPQKWGTRPWAPSCFYLWIQMWNNKQDITKTLAMHRFLPCGDTTKCKQNPSTQGLFNI